MTLEEVTNEEFFEWFSQVTECPDCIEDYRYVKRVDFVRSEGKGYFNVTYECGHRRLVPILEEYT